MLLYHYTSHVFLPFIHEEGLSLGMVLISLKDRMNAVWLTHDATQRATGWLQTQRYVTNFRVRGDAKST
jgi:hypothetical protein